MISVNEEKSQGKYLYIQVLFKILINDTIFAASL